MSKKTPDKREQNRLIKIEKQRQSKRTRAVVMVIDGYSFRRAAEILKESHQFVANWVKRCTNRTVTIVNGKRIVRYEKKKEIRDLVKTRKPGPPPGNCPVVDRIKDTVVSVKRKNMRIGAEKIGIMAQVSASAPTVRKALYGAGFPPVTVKKGRRYKSFTRPFSNDLWQIDYVELGKDRITGSQVHFLSVIDDHSRRILSVNALSHATTDDVISILSECVDNYGTPKQILSDHGCQWYSVSSGECRFDHWCEEKGIEHIMGGIRKPTTTGKVERWHGSIRREADLPKEASVDEYLGVMSEYSMFYNYSRPHYAIGLMTPAEAYEAGFE